MISQQLPCLFLNLATPPNGSERLMFGFAKIPANGRRFSQKCEKFGIFLRNPRKKFIFRLELSEKIGMVIG